MSPPRRRHTIRYLGLLGLSIGVILAGIAALNYTVDPAGLLNRDGAEREIADTLNRGKFIVYDYAIAFRDRVVQKLVAENRAPAPSAVLFGSSRTWSIRADMIGRDNFFNHSVSAGVLEDYVGIHNTYRKLAHRPDLVIVAAEPWILNKNNGSWRFVQVLGDFLEMVRLFKIKIPPARYARDQQQTYLSALLSLSYAKESWKLLEYRRRRPQQEFIIADHDDFPLYVYRPDGSMKSKQTNGTAAQPTPIDELRNNPRFRNITYLGWFDELDVFYRRVFEQFVDHLLARGSRVVFYIAPYHPAAYENIMTLPRYQRVREADAFFRGLAQERGIPVIGNMDPAAVNCTSHEFKDPIHANADCIGRIFAKHVAVLRP